MSSENNENLFDEEHSTLIYENLDENNSLAENTAVNNPLAEIMDRMNNLSLASFSPKKADVSDSSVDISNISQEENKSTLHKSDDMVYLQCFVDTIRALQKKFNKIMKNKFVHKDVVADVFEKIQSGDSESAKKSLHHILDKKVVHQINYKEISNFIEITFPMLFKQIMENLENLSLIKQELFSNNKSILGTFHDQNNQAIKVRNEFNDKIKKFMNEISDIIKIPEDEFFSFLLDYIKKTNQEIINLKNENKTLKDNSEVDELKKQLEEKKQTIKQLQSQNVSFSEVITKLDTTNIKLKKECVILSNEYKKVVDSIKLKSGIIEKQKKILEVLQKQVGGKHDFPIEDLKKKIEKIKRKLEKEENLEKKAKLQKEVEDYQKRVEDFENLHKK